MSATVSLVLARADNGVIGANNAIPWRIPEDMKRFKAITMGKPIVMGRKTWDSFPKKPLPGRTNIVITRDRGWKADGAVVVHSLEMALARAESEHPSEIAVIGGAEIYKLALPHADIVYLTEVRADAKGDVSLPPFDPALWHETAREDHATPDGLRYSYVTLTRR
ncbi:MAG TPA: dihydrofolate reductase [Rhizomicrobium sp.]|nr:dihydrofolate reductase [Rhizomicrobium sp.]